jgi:anti-anti-sigma regulatory factor
MQIDTMRGDPTMTVIRNQTGDQGTITLEGELTLPRAEELKSALLKALVSGGALNIRFGAVQDVDLSCLQVLCSAHKSAVRMKKQIRFGGTVPKILKDAAEAAGYTRLTGCKLDPEKSCLWIAVAGAPHE